MSARQCFTQIVYRHMLDKVVLHTKEQMNRIRANYFNQSSTVYPINNEEMLMFLGILVNTAVIKDNHLASKGIFDHKSGTQYKCVMNSERFNFIFNCLQFDDRATSFQRKSMDPFAPIRELWEMFTYNCHSSYSPESFTIVDEQL